MNSLRTGMLWLALTPLAMADEPDLCQINLQEIDDYWPTIEAMLEEPAKGSLEQALAQAKAAQQAGKVNQCIVLSTQVLDSIKGLGGDGSGASGASGY